MAGADAAIEASVEKVGPKKEAFATLDGILSPDTLFLTNTSSISITDLASATNRPDKVCGTHFFTPPPVREAVEVGAAGVVHKSTVMDEVIEAVRRVRAGETLLPLDEVVELLRFAGLQREQEQKARQAIAQLTPREKEVLQALAEGLDSKEIAERLRISVPTERNHVASILAKLGVHSRLQALIFAVKHGVVEIR